jgi:hypothetical protein
VTLTTGGDAGPAQIALQVGHKVKDGYYLTRTGKDPIFVVSEFAGGRFLPTAESFVKEAPKPTAAAAPAMQNPHGGLPPGTQLPPGVAEMLRKQQQGQAH